MSRIGFRLRTLGLAIVCLVPSGSAFAQAPSSIQVFMPNGGIPSHAVRLPLVRDDGYQNIVFTDSSGIFLIATPRTQTVHYTVTIPSDGQTYATTVASFTQDRSSPNRTSPNRRSSSRAHRRTPRRSTRARANRRARPPVTSTARPSSSRWSPWR